MSNYNLNLTTAEDVSNYNKSHYNILIENYIYLYHTNEWLVLPVYPESITDSLSSTFATTNVLSRSAPLFSYSYSGPRQVQVNFDLHRDMMNEVNLNVAKLRDGIEIGDDYVDTLIKKLQSVALPNYKATSKAVDPPRVALRFGNEIFIKGVVNSGITVTYKKPILENKKYALVSIAFTVSETAPYDAVSVGEQGSFRGITAAFKGGIYATEDKVDGHFN